MEPKDFVEKYRYLIAAMLIVFILVVGGYVYIERDKIFLTEVKIQYPDGCIEVFHNNVLVTPICEEGRKMDEMNKMFNQNEQQWNINTTFPK